MEAGDYSGFGGALKRENSQIPSESQPQHKLFFENNTLQERCGIALTFPQKYWGIPLQIHHRTGLHFAPASI